MLDHVIPPSGQKYDNPDWSCTSVASNHTSIYIHPELYVENYIIDILSKIFVCKDKKKVKIYA